MGRPGHLELNGVARRLQPLCWPSLKPYALPVWQEAPLVLAATATACVLTYEVGRRAGVLRTLFGLKALGSPVPGHDAASAVEAGRTRPA